VGFFNVAFMPFVCLGYDKVVQALLAAGAAVNAVSHQRLTALHMASMEGGSTVATMLNVHLPASWWAWAIHQARSLCCVLRTRAILRESMWVKKEG
jgi:hypothetical protein